MLDSKKKMGRAHYKSGKQKSSLVLSEARKDVIECRNEQQRVSTINNKMRELDKINK